MSEFREDLVNEIKSFAQSENLTDRESFFQIYMEMLEESEIVEDFNYLYFSGTGSNNRSVQIDGYSYNELDEKLSLYIIPPLSYYENRTFTITESDKYFKRLKYFYLDAKKIILGAEESSEGYGLALDIVNKRMKIKVLDLVILTDNQSSSKIDRIESRIENDIRMDYAIYDLNRMEVMKESKGGKEALVINLKEDFECKGIPTLPASKTDNYEAYLCNIPGMILAKMYDKYQSRLLEGNVRSFLQIKGKVNKGIRGTILNEPEMFFAYNNGIAATAESMEFEETENGLMITSFKALQIVNGGQTTASLANAWINDTNSNSKEKIKKIFVPMKVSIVSYESSQDLIPNISKFANSQNKVSDADLASNHPFHVKIEELSRRIASPALDGQQFGTYWYYERANGQYRQETYKSTRAVKKRFEARNPRKQMFKKVDLAKFFNIYLMKPNIASAGAQKSFNSFSVWMTKEWEKDQNFVNENFYRKIISLAILFRQTDKIVREQIWYDSYKANIVAYTLSSIFYRINCNFPDLVVDFAGIWKKQTLSQAWVTQIKKVSKLMYNHLTKSDRTVENVTEWAKRETSWIQAKEVEYDFELEFLNELVNKDYQIAEDHASKRYQKETNEISATLDVFNYGAPFWKEVYDWGMKENIWDYQDLSFLKIAMSIDKGKIPTDKQSLRIMDILEKARSESFPK